MRLRSVPVNLVCFLENLQVSKAGFVVELSNRFDEKLKLPEGSFFRDPAEASLDGVYAERSEVLGINFSPQVSLK